ETVWSTEYTPFGSLTFEEGKLKRAAKFTGKDLDEDTGLYYFNARWYDQSIGRFISEDLLPYELMIIGAKETNGGILTFEKYIEDNGLNWYVYCNNNPLIYIDPEGMFKVYKKSLGRDIAKHIETGEIRAKVLFGVQLSFDDPLEVAAKMGISIISPKVGIAIGVIDIISDFDKGDTERGLTGIAGLMDETVGAVKDSISLVDALYDYAIKTKLEKEYGEEALTKIYSKSELMETLTPILEEVGLEYRYNLEKMIVEADFETWAERFVARFIGIDDKEWYKYEQFDPFK
ncbi:MAG TPA: RHS repeat-associated core domain-containing protein, partial [Chitinophagaceae bacterium]|nr:RHS repeat-associated core domain-containing protein [Chitinophagaceae bacterium]